MTFGSSVGFIGKTASRMCVTVSFSFLCLYSDVRFVESLGAACRFLCLKQSLALDMVCRKVRLEGNLAR